MESMKVFDESLSQRSHVPPQRVTQLVSIISTVHYIAATPS